MRKWITKLLGLLMMGIALAPVAARAQDVPRADLMFPGAALPIYDTPGSGIFLSGEFVMFRQTNPLEHQPIAFEGFYDADGSITGTIGRRVGSGRTVLFADDAGGPASYQPGFRIGAGYRFESGVTAEVSWMHLATAGYSASATYARPFFRGGPRLRNSFITAPVFNFPNQFTGPLNDVGRGDPGATFGVWNAADDMTIEFTQRTEQIEASVRFPIHETENWRSYCVIGPSFFWIWERFWWRSLDLAVDGTSNGTHVGLYSNIVSNRMYGAHVGWGNEWWLGGGFAASVDIGAAGLMDFVKERAKYELGVKRVASNKRSINDWEFVPEVTANVNLWWYPCEGIQIRAGYNVMAFFNTIAGREPVVFNYGAMDPPWEKVHRFFDGLNIGAAIIF